MPQGVRISPTEGAILRQLLAGATLPRDALPYTDEFQKLKRHFTKRTKRVFDDVDFWRILARVGKRGGLARKANRKQAPSAPTLTDEQQLEILRLMPEGIGSRDGLPYTAEFDRLHRQFSKLTGKKLTQWEFWRVLSRVGKRSRKLEPLFASAPPGELPPNTVKLLDDLNPWWRAEPARKTERYRRWAFQETWHRLQGGLTPVVAIRGPRQVGKTTILNQLIEHLLLIEGVDTSRILHVQFDDVPGLGSLPNPVLSIVRWFEKHVLRMSLNQSAERDEPVYLFFDELQNLKAWAPQLKMLVDLKSARTLVTGSSSLRILRGQDSLAGRLSVIELGPLRLSEIAGIRQLGAFPQVDGGEDLSNWTDQEFWLRVADHARKHPAVIQKAFARFSELGGYPICHHRPEAKRSELARQIVDVVVQRTIEHDKAVDPRHRRTWDKPLLRETFRQICRYIGQSITPDRICQEINKVLQSQFKSTQVDNAIQFLVDAMLVHRIEPLEVALKKRANGAKLCLCDHFVREAWLQERVPMTRQVLAGSTQTVSTLAGHVMESVIGYYLKGIAGLDVAWLPAREHEQQPEIDYVLTIGLKRVPIEVKYVRGKLSKRHFAPLERFCSNPKYNAAFGLLITQETSGRLTDSVIALPAAAFLSVI